MPIEHQLVDIFCEIDDFCKGLNRYRQSRQLEGPNKSQRDPASCLSIFLPVFHLAREKHHKVKLSQNLDAPLLDDFLA